MKAFAARLLDLLYPPRCAFCRRLLIERERDVCRLCRRRYENRAVRREIGNGVLCVAPLRYEDSVRRSLLRYKFHGVTAYSAAYAEFLAKAIDGSDISCDIITWVPLSRQRLRRRGYDQARLLAEETAKRLDVPCEQLLIKTVDNRPQSGIRNAAERRKNAEGVYALSAPEKVKDRRVLVIDDIVTTGATLSACTLVLQRAGCAAVYAAAAASRH